MAEGGSVAWRDEESSEEWHRLLAACGLLSARGVQVVKDSKRGRQRGVVRRAAGYCQQEVIGARAIVSKRCSRW